MVLRKDILWRIGVVYAMILILAVAIFGRIIYLQFVEGDEWREKANNISQKDITILPNRGDICGNDGRLLASSVPYYEIRMDLQSSGLTDEVFHSQIDSLCYALHDMFGDRTAAEYKERFLRERARGNRYFLVKRKVSYSQLEEARKFPIFRLGQFKGGLIVEQKNRRTKPFVKLASRTIGYLYEDKHGEIVGKVGLERAYERELRGVKGVRLMQKIAGGVWMPVKGANEVEPKDGKDIITTIDINLQDVAENALLRQLQRNDAHHGTAVLMEVSTGEIKAIANLEKSGDVEYQESYNYAIGESTEPGSTFKLPVLMVALEDGVVDLTDSVDTEYGKKKYHDQIMYDSELGRHETLSVLEAFAASSNVGISKIIWEHYRQNPQKLLDRLYGMNLHEKLDLEIKGEGKPLIKSTNDKTWSGTTIPWMAIGYEVRLTPLQLLTFYNAVANNGRMVKPKFVKALRFHGEVVQTLPTEVINPLICSKETVSKAQEMLLSVVENGTGRNLRNPNYKIAGKTGTAQIANKDYGYKMDGQTSYQSSFVGYFPADNPRYSCIVVINGPSRADYYGSRVAGPVFKEIADKVYATSSDLQKDIDSLNFDNCITIPYSKNGSLANLERVTKELGIPLKIANRNSEWVSTHKEDSSIVCYNRYVDRKVVPDVVGMGARDAIYLLENTGLRVVMIGKGTVKKQSMPSGTLTRKGAEIVIEMSS